MTNERKTKQIFEAQPHRRRRRRRLKKEWEPYIGEMERDKYN